MTPFLGERFVRYFRSGNTSLTGSGKGERTMIKLKVSYEHPEELKRLLKKLGPDVKSWKASQNREGKFLKAYVVMKETREN